MLRILAAILPLVIAFACAGRTTPLSAESTIGLETSALIVSTWTGDVNEDSVIDISDVQCSVLMALHLDPEPMPTCLTSPEKADRNCDNSVNVVDVQICVGIVLNTLLDENGIPNDQDIDGDNVHNSCDLCPENFDPLQEDADNDGTGDACANTDPICGDDHCSEPETCSECPEDCGDCCVPQCSGKNCGEDGCGGVCGFCDAGSVCMEQICTACAESESCNQSDDDCDSAVDEGAESIYGASCAQTPSFPGARGFGATSVGGRGGDVYVVDTLEDDPASPQPGTLRYALEASGARTVVFAVGGTIVLKGRIRVLNPYLTIAGQSAPSPGITLRMGLGYGGPLIQVKTYDVIIRYLRFRRGSSAGLCQGGQICFGDNDCPFGGCSPKKGDNLSLLDGSQKVVTDHLSLTWSTDENMEIFTVDMEKPISDISVQHLLIAEGLNDFDAGNAMGLLVAGNQATNTWRNISRVSIHKNVLAHNTHRNPRIGAKGAEVVNNLIYNWYARLGSSIKGTHIDWVNNQFIPGPLLLDERLILHDSTDSQGEPYNEENGYQPPSIYIEGNQTSGIPDFLALNSDNWGMILHHYLDGTLDTEWRRTQRMAQGIFPVLVNPAPQNSNRSLLTNTGAHSRVDCQGEWHAAMDATDLRIITEVRLGGGPAKIQQLLTDPYDAEGYPEPSSAPPCVDSDEDGMPDEWEDIHGLNSDNPQDGTIDLDGDGFTQLEEYLNGTSPTKPNHSSQIRWVDLSWQGTAGGFILASPPGFVCGDTCATQGFHDGQAIALTALGASFATWTAGPCEGSEDPVCRFSVDVDTQASAQFGGAGSLPALTVVQSGDGAGNITVSPDGEPCGPNCSTYPEGTLINLTAAGASSEHNFARWTSGPCTGTEQEFSTTCSFQLTKDTEITGLIGHGFRIRAKAIGTGTGAFEFGEEGLVDICGDDCLFFSANQATLNVEALPDPGSSFIKWTTGGCQLGAPTVPVCQNLANTKNRLLKAEFDLD